MVAMPKQVIKEYFPAVLPPSVWVKKLPFKVGTIVFIRNFSADNTYTKFNFEISIFFPVTFFINLIHREFHVGSQVPEHRDAFEPIYGCSASLLLRGACKGGQFNCEKTILKLPRLTLFNGTRYLHSVKPIEEGSRDMLLAAMYFAPWPAPICTAWRKVRNNSSV
jgi:hypothetical protein